jgi:hypothetical protein
MYNRFPEITTKVSDHSLPCGFITPPPPSYLQEGEIFFSPEFKGRSIGVMCGGKEIIIQEAA